MRLVANECQSLICAKDIRVFLNGERVRKCTIADEERGFIERIMLDQKGNPVIDFVQNDVVRVIERGIVRIEILDHK